LPKKQLCFRFGCALIGVYYILIQKQTCNTLQMLLKIRTIFNSK
jgi:hypothetical protein